MHHEEAPHRGAHLRNHRCRRRRRQCCRGRFAGRGRLGRSTGGRRLPAAGNQHVEVARAALRGCPRRIEVVGVGTVPFKTVLSLHRTDPALFQTGGVPSWCLASAQYRPRGATASDADRLRRAATFEPTQAVLRSTTSERTRHRAFHRLSAASARWVFWSAATCAGGGHGVETSAACRGLSGRARRGRRTGLDPSSRSRNVS